MNKNELKGKKIGVLMGGMSAERDISLKTGEAVLKALNRLGYKCAGIDVGRDIAEKLRTEEIEIAFIALHGRYGEDGCIQGMLEILDIPYTGSGVTASALSLNKVVTKRLFTSLGLPTPDFKVVSSDSPLMEDFDLPFPLIVKPVSEGSTIGVNKVEDKESLRSIIEETLKIYPALLVEEFIEGAEVTFGIMEGKVFPPIEIRPAGGLYDYKAKYTRGMTDYIVPAPLEKEICRMGEDMAIKTYRSIGCRGAARVDMLINRKGIWILEINTIPGMTETSLLPKAAGVVGVSFDDLVEEMVLSARLGD